MKKVRDVKNKIMVTYCIPYFAKGIFTVMISNYLVYFYQPSEESRLPIIITQGTVFLGLLTIIGVIKAIGDILDVFTDPIVASVSDKCTHKDGRRIPFMKYSAIPYAICAFMIFCAPNNEPSILNNIWIAIFIWGYFIFYTLYMIPYLALLPEMITNSTQRVNAYTMGSFAYVTGNGVGYAAPAIVEVFKNVGLAAISAWRITFAIFAVIGGMLLFIPTIIIKEKDYVHPVKPKDSIIKSIKHIFRNKNFVWAITGQLLEGTGMAFFQTCLMYYVVSLLDLPESASVWVLAIVLVGSLLLYPAINKLMKKKGKKIPLIIGCIIFIIAEFTIFLGADLQISNSIKAIIMAVMLAVPYAAFNIIPSSMIADIIEYDTIVTGINEEGVFSAVKSFTIKISQSMAIMIVPSLIIIGALNGDNIGRFGVRLTALVGGILCLISIFAFYKYDEREIFKKIKEKES